ncbi:MAG: enolase [Paenibacillaceae bacterium]|nr:enolase [Paenibacillaceae bacterium]
MNIASVEVYTYKVDKHYKITGVEETPNLIPGTDYYFEKFWPQPYSRKLESCLVKITTDNGLVGWGEAQAPILPEAAATIIGRLFGPSLIGSDPLANEVVYDRLYNMMEVRGHGSSFIHDAIAGIDIALWDIKGKHYGVPVCDLLGGPFTRALPCYVSGLREETLEKNCQAAIGYKEAGYAGIKLFVGHGMQEDLHIIRSVRKAVGDNYPIYVDLMWKYDLGSAKRIGKELDALGILWIEAPLKPYDIPAHQALAKAVEAPLAVGEPLRTIQEFQPWFAAGAIGVAQPDLVRAGITSGWKICNLAKSFNVPAALHLGGCTIIGTAATWQVAAALPNFLIQEYQMGLFESNVHMLHEPLQVKDAKLVVPQKPGLGIDVNEEFIRANSSEQWQIDAAGVRRTELK